MIEAGQVLPLLKSFPWGRYVKFAFLTGSLAVGGRGNDVDVAISRVGLEEYGELLYQLVKALGVDEDHIDLIPIDEDTPCPLVLEALRNSIPLYVADWDLVYRIFNICQDHQMDAKKLRLYEAAVAAALHEN